MTGLAEALTSFYAGRRILVTGHTGFKGSWLTLWLRKMGATTVGVALPPTSPLSMFSSAELASDGDQFCDVRTAKALSDVFEEFKPSYIGLHF